MKIIFFGSSDFSLPALKACLDSAHEVVLVISTPDKRKGRGLQLEATPVKIFCTQNGIPCVAPENLKNPENVETIRRLAPDLFVVSSYGKLIPSAILNLAAKYRLNVHPSLLPKYRGASPIQTALLNGDTVTGMSVADVTPEMDAGDIFYQQEIPIYESDTSISLFRKLADLSYEAILEVFSQLSEGPLPRVPQNPLLATFTKKIKKEDGLIQWTDSARKIVNQVRALTPWPAAFVQSGEQNLQVLEARVLNEADSEKSVSKPGQILEVSKNGCVTLRAGDGVVEIARVKPAGKREMTAAEFIRGKRLRNGDFFSV